MVIEFHTCERKKFQRSNRKHFFKLKFEKEKNVCSFIQISMTAFENITAVYHKTTWVQILVPFFTKSCDLGQIIQFVKSSVALSANWS